MYKFKQTERRLQFDIAYMKMALAFSELSYARRHKVGALIVNDEDQIISQGFNGTPSGFDNNCEYDWCGKFDKNIDDCRIGCEFAKDNKCTDCGYFKLKTKPEVIHAEPNAITKCAKSHNSTDGATMYVTLSPCIECAKLIIASGIKRVVYMEDYHNAEGTELLKKANILVEQLDLTQENISLKKV